MTTSNVPITPGSGDNIATYSYTEDAITKQLQRVAINDVTGANSATVKAASTAPVASDPALVVAMSPNAIDLGSGTGGSHTQRVIMDSSQLGTLGTNTASSSVPVTLPTDGAPISLAQTPVVTASSYTTGFEVGGLMTFSSIGRAPNSSGIIQDVTLTSKTVQTAEFDIYLFNSNPSNSTWTDHASPAINAADVSKLIGVVKMTKNYSGLGTHTIYKPDETTFAPIPFSGATLYAVMVVVGTPTFGSTSDLVVTLGVI